jgi:mycothiol synthase
VRAATRADGVGPLSEHVTLHLCHGGEGPDRNLLLRSGGLLAGYCHLDPTDAVAGSAAELVVHPDHRRLGHGRRLVQAAVAESPDGSLRLWAHGDHPGARALAASLGFSEERQLWQLRRSLTRPLPAARLPEGVRLRAFRPGADDDAWLALNRRAFADHPEQGRWTAADLRRRLAEDWFDADGFLIAEDSAEDGAQDRSTDARPPPIVAFHWTKVHGGGTGHGHDPIGEVYVVGVEPQQRGRGLGRAITVAGLQWLRSRGVSRAMLYVDADNAAAVAIYRQLGFTRFSTDVMFSRSSSGRPG